MKGWAYMMNHGKAHYYVSGKSACGFGGVPDSFTAYAHPTEQRKCKRCLKRK